MERNTLSRVEKCQRIAVGSMSKLQWSKHNCVVIGTWTSKGLWGRKSYFWCSDKAVETMAIPILWTSLVSFLQLKDELCTSGGTSYLSETLWIWNICLMFSFHAKAELQHLWQIILHTCSGTKALAGCSTLLENQLNTDHQLLQFLNSQFLSSQISMLGQGMFSILYHPILFNCMCWTLRDQIYWDILLVPIIQVLFMADISSI